LLVLSSNNFLLGKEDLRYHPARRNDQLNSLIRFNSVYHDTYREWIENDKAKTNYQYDLGLELKLPINFFGKKMHIDLGAQKLTNSSVINSEYKEAEFSLKNWSAYSINGNFLLDESTNKIGLNIKYLFGDNDADLRINKYPEDYTDGLVNKYFYSLLEPAFGREIKFSLKGYAFSYALEYTRIINPTLNFGVSLYSENNNYDAGINYYSSVEKLEGSKNLSGLLSYTRYTLGFSCEYSQDKFILRNLITYSVPRYKLLVDQEQLLKKNNVNLEISNLGDGRCSGNGLSCGIGVGYSLSGNISAVISYTMIWNNYSGSLQGSTPVLGFDILPVAHQLDSDFNDKMKNHLLSFVFNQEFSSTWKYSFGLEYLSSNNSINYDYKIITEFGFGNLKEKSSYILLGDKIGRAHV